MRWFQLTLIDSKQKRVIGCPDAPWILSVLSEQPRTIDEFVQTETRVHATSIFCDGLNNPTLRQMRRAARWFNKDPAQVKLEEIASKMGPNFAAHRRNTQAGLSRSSSGGTMIVDLKEQVVTVKGYPQYEMSQVPPYQRRAFRLEGGAVVHKRTGEVLYHGFGLISLLRKGTTDFSKIIRRTPITPQSYSPFYKQIDRQVRNPTRQNPVLISRPRFTIDKKSGRVDFYLQKTAHWKAPYILPDCYVLCDGITNKRY